ncbi:hypothetical protein WJX81_000044 [Elliptochloris bilobata]|uniref:Uncharacterized protein n=1 Tax=Elliptochloris bilobata TaxID=381761 RepID=A0AAW1QIZ3_9CHLO
MVAPRCLAGALATLLCLPCIAAANKQRLGAQARNIYAVASPGFKESDAAALGRWRTDADGRHLAMRVRSEGAKSQQLLFSDLRIPDGGCLRLHAPGAPDGNACAYGDCAVLTSTNAPRIGKFTAPKINGPEIVLQYSEPPMAYGGSLALRILAVMQGFGDYLMQLPPPPEASGTAPAVGEGPGFRRGSSGRAHEAGRQSFRAFDPSAFQPQPDRAARCTSAVACHPEHVQEAAAVVVILVVDTRMGVLGHCTGTFVTTNDTLSESHYVVSASHCFTSGQPDDMQYWTLVFNYDAPCGRHDPPAAPSHVVQGVRLVFYDDNSDLLLLQHASQIPHAYKPFLMGYNADPDFTPNQAFVIHHPGGNGKRISFANDRCE